MGEDALHRRRVAPALVDALVLVRKAGLQIGDRIIRVNDKDVSTRSEVLDAVAKSSGKAMTLDVRRAAAMPV